MATRLVHRTASGLPDFCAYRLPSDGSPILLRRGMRAYYPAPEIFPEEFNHRHGVTPVQAKAMFLGAACGWHVPGATPAVYDEEDDDNVG